MKNPVSATLRGLFEMTASAPATAELSPEDRLDGRTALVTGANRGLGLAVATGLAARGAGPGESRVARWRSVAGRELWMRSK